MADTFTNVEAVKHGIVDIFGVKSITLDKVIDPLLSQADGARGDSVVGDLGIRFDVTIETESDGADTREGQTGFDNIASLVFKTQLDSTPATLKTYTVTNVWLGNWGVSTDQANPNGETVSGRTKSPADDLTIS